MGDKRGTAPYDLHEFEGRKERESENGTTKQKDAKSNGCQLKMSHAVQHGHDKSPSQPFPKKPRRHDFPCAAPSSGQDVSFAKLQTTEGSRSQLLSGFLLSADRLIGFRDVGSRSQLGFGEMAKHKPHKFACSTLRLEGPALRKRNTKTPKAVEDTRTDEVKTLKAKKTRTNQVVDTW